MSHFRTDRATSRSTSRVVRVFAARGLPKGVSDEKII